jgi:hypothetical protein
LEQEVGLLDNKHTEATVLAAHLLESLQLLAVVAVPTLVEMGQTVHAVEVVVAVTEVLVQVELALWAVMVVLPQAVTNRVEVVEVWEGMEQQLQVVLVELVVLEVLL